MNVIEKIRSILQSFSKIADICDTIHVDFANPEPTSYGLSSVGDELVSVDVLGNQTRQHNFMLYSTFSGINDYERLSNSGALLELAQWLSLQDGEVTHEIEGKTYTGEIIRISAANGMIYNVPQENTADAIQYQLQISVKYTVNT